MWTLASFRFFIENYIRFGHKKWTFNYPFCYNVVCFCLAIVEPMHVTTSVTNPMCITTSVVDQVCIITSATKHMHITTIIALSIHFATNMGSIDDCELMLSILDGPSWCW
jgi:hypothetical protein